MASIDAEEVAPRAIDNIYVRFAFYVFVLHEGPPDRVESPTRHRVELCDAAVVTVI